MIWPVSRVREHMFCSTQRATRSRLQRYHWTVFVCSLKFSFPQGLAANTTQAQLKQFFHLTAVPFKRVRLGAKRMRAHDSCSWQAHHRHQPVVSLRTDGVRGRAAARQLCRVEEPGADASHALWFEEASTLALFLLAWKLCRSCESRCDVWAVSQTWMLFSLNVVNMKHS
jgi:hypothetical protein